MMNDVSSQPAVKLRRGQQYLDVDELPCQFRVHQAHPEHFRPGANRHAEQSMTQIRTLSYLLHPPFLDETGLVSALRWYAAGFAERSGIAVDLELPESIERLPLDTETALFRIVQESLINIHRHAGSETARIRLERDAETLVLEIEDRGHGIPRPRASAS
jgi:signal transduction histidine kinase